MMMVPMSVSGLRRKTGEDCESKGKKSGHWNLPHAD
jgi:hypothetical protein